MIKKAELYFYHEYDKWYGNICFVLNEEGRAYLSNFQNNSSEIAELDIEYYYSSLAELVR